MRTTKEIRTASEKYSDEIPSGTTLIDDDELAHLLAIAEAVHGLSEARQAYYNAPGATGEAFRAGERLVQAEQRLVVCDAAARAAGLFGEVGK